MNGCIGFFQGRNSGGGGIEGGDRGWVEGGLWEGKGSGRGRSEGGSGRCSKSKESTMRLKSKQRTKARDRGAKKKAEDDICLTSLAGREKDEKGATVMRCRGHYAHNL